MTGSSWLHHGPGTRANKRGVSNFLLWQISYAEIHICPTLWPDFDAEALNEAIKDFGHRERRFGGVEANQ